MPRLALILDPHGHVEHELHLVDDGDRTWITVEPGTQADVVAYLQSMRFLLRVEVEDATGRCAVVGSVGDPAVLADAFGKLAAPLWQVPAEFAGTGATPAGSDRGGDAGRYVPHRPGVFPGVERLVARERLAGVLATAPARAGTWAWEACRVAAAVPRLGLETDDRTLPHEVGWIGPAVHLAKGCYRGQEAVARTHNMGRPPRRLVLLHLDGSSDDLPAHASPVTLDGRAVGWIGTSCFHYESGPIATAVVKGRTDPVATLSVAAMQAAQEAVVVTGR
jgi:folate-binding protein YgfZ